MPAREPFVIAVIDDDPNVRELLAVIGKRAGGVVLEAGSVEEGVRLLRECPWDIAIIDRRLRHERALALAMIDLDGFKSINDKFGHRIGDQVLTDVSTLITQGIRSSDIVARYGGDEFAIILPETTLEEAFMLAERLRSSIYM